MKRVAIIGSGIAGQMIAYQLLKNESLFSINWFSADDFTPPCTLSSTSVVRKAGIQKGISPLGDLLSESFESFECLYQDNSLLHPAIEKALHHQCCHLESSKLQQFKARFTQFQNYNFFALNKTLESRETAYIIEPLKLHQIITEHFLSLTRNRIYDHQYISREQLQKMKSEYDYIFVATGHQGKTHNPSTPIRENVSGHYLEFESCFLPHEYQSKSWSMSIDGINLIHRNSSHKLLISAANLKQDMFLASPHETRELYKKIRNIVDHWKWPDISRDNLRVGVRSKGIKRMPCSFWEDSKTAYLNGLYKNGFSFSVKLAYDLTRRCF